MRINLWPIAVAGLLERLGDGWTVPRLSHPCPNTPPFQSRGARPGPFAQRWARTTGENDGQFWSVCTPILLQKPPMRPPSAMHPHASVCIRNLPQWGSRVHPDDNPPAATFLDVK